MKPLIDTDDFVINGQNVTSSKLPFFINDKTEYIVLRSHQNYGIMMAANMANRRIGPIINAIRDVVEGKENAMDVLKEIYNDHKE